MNEIAADRLKLERAIIGSCLLENRYGQIADIITHKNFSKEDINAAHFFDHQLIVKVFEQYYPTKPIDLITVSHELRRIPGAAGYLVELTEAISSTANIKYYSLCLLEYNLRNSFTKLLHNQMSKGKLDNIALQAIQDIMNEVLDHDNDIFDVIDRARIYLNNELVDKAPLDAIIDFGKKMESRIHEIRRLASIDCLLTNLNNLNKLPDDFTTQLAVNHLTEILKAVIAKGKIENDFANRIFSLTA